MTIAGVDLRIEKIKVLQADTLHDRNAGASISRGYMVVLAALDIGTIYYVGWNRGSCRGFGRVYTTSSCLNP